MASMLPPSFSTSVDYVTRYIYTFLALLIAVQLIAVFLGYMFGWESRGRRILIFKVTNAIGLLLIGYYLLSTMK